MRVPRILALVAGSAYLTWRLLFTWQGAHPVMFFLLFAAEAFGALRLWMELSLLGDTRPATRTPEYGLAPDADGVVVVTDEPLSEVRAAVLSARLVRGCRDILVVDRDDRPDVGQLADRLEVQRVAGGLHADLGELITTAIDNGNSLFTLLVPADVVVLPDVLEVVAPAFEDPGVGVVNCRIENTNAAHEVDFGGYGEELVRDTLMIDRLDRAGALPWWPGMAVIRRSALSDAGGVASGRQGVTLATGIRLQAAGWRITDVPVFTARRLAPWSDDRHLHRWARNLHERISVLVDRDLPRRNPHATRLSRRVLRLADVHVGRAVQRLVLIGILFATVYTSSLPMVAPPLLLIPLWGAWMASSLTVRREALGPVGFTPWIIDDLRLLTTDLAVAWKALPGKELDVELVDSAPGRRQRTVLLIVLQVALIGTVAAFGTGLARPRHGDFVTVVILGASAWLSVMVLQARSALKLVQRRQSFRTGERLDVLVSDAAMRVVGMSPFGIDVVTGKPMQVGAKVRVALALPQSDGSSMRFDCPTSVRRTMQEGTRHLSYLRFSLLPDDTADRITEYCAVVAGHKALRDDTEDPSYDSRPESAATSTPGPGRGPETDDAADVTV